MSSWTPVFYVRHTATETILQFVQDFKNCMQSPNLTLCGKDENLLLGQVDSIDAVDYKGLAPQVYDLLAARLWVCTRLKCIVRMHSRCAQHLD